MIHEYSCLNFASSSVLLISVQCERVLCYSWKHNTNMQDFRFILSGMEVSSSIILNNLGITNLDGVIDGILF